MTEIYRALAGSRLFGCSTKDSDYDYKSVFVPDARSILLGNSSVSDFQQTEGDVSTFSFQKYLHLLCKMEINSIEMLFAEPIIKSDVWTKLYNNRYKLLNKNKKAFTGFAKSQAMRYAVRGDRYNTLKKVVDTLEDLYEPTDRLSSEWDCLQF